MSLAAFRSEGRRKQIGKQKLKSKPRWRQKLEQVWQRLKMKVLFHIGVFSLHRGKYQRAAQILEQVAQFLDEDPFVQVHLGWSHWHLGHPVTARRHLLRATELDPNNPVFWTLAGKLMALRGKWDEAEQLLRQAVLLSSENIVAQSWLALVLLQKGQVEEALDILKKTPVADDPYLQSRLVLHLERLMMERNLGEGAIFPSVPNWLKLPILSSFIGLLFRWRGERLIEDGEWEKAARFLGTASQLRPKDVWAKLLWVVALLEEGFWNQAEQVLNEVPEVVPERVWVYGALLFRQRKVRDAVARLTKGDTTHPFVRYYLALSLDWIGEAEYACAAYLEPLYREDPSSLRQRIRELVRKLKP